MNLLVFFVAVVQISSVTPVIHTLNYFTTVSQVAKLPEFLEVAYVDDVQILQFDSNHRKTKAKHDWVNKITEDHPQFWERETATSIRNEQLMKDNIETAKKNFNQTGGVHMIQVMKGCEWNDEMGEVNSWEHYGYDGEDFLSFEAKTMTWIAAHPQFSKIKRDQLDGFNRFEKYDNTWLCPGLLKKHLRNGKDFLTRTELPKVSLLQKTPSSPVTCHATGFYPITSSLFWRKNGEEIHEDVQMGATLPNHDGTFQTSVDLKVEVTPAAEQEYECVFQLDGVPEDIVINLDAGSILSNARIQEEEDWKKAVAIAVPLVVLNVVAMVMAVVVVAMILDKHLKRKQGERQVFPSSGTSKENRCQREPAKDSAKDDRQGRKTGWKTTAPTHTESPITSSTHSHGKLAPPQRLITHQARPTMCNLISADQRTLNIAKGPALYCTFLKTELSKQEL